MKVSGISTRGNTVARKSTHRTVFRLYEATKRERERERRPFRHLPCHPRPSHSQQEGAPLADSTEARGLRRRQGGGGCTAVSGNLSFPVNKRHADLEKTYR